MSWDASSSKYIMPTDPWATRVIALQTSIGIGHGGVHRGRSPCVRTTVECDCQKHSKITGCCWNLKAGRCLPARGEKDIQRNAEAFLTGISTQKCPCRGDWADIIAGKAGAALKPVLAEKDPEKAVKLLRDYVGTSPTSHASPFTAPHPATLTLSQPMTAMPDDSWRASARGHAPAGRTASRRGGCCLTPSGRIFGISAARKSGTPRLVADADLS